MCVQTLRTVLIFTETINFRGHMHRFTLKNECFSIYLLWKHHKCVLKPSEQCSFFWDVSIWGVTCLGLVEKWMIILTYVLGSTLNVCSDPRKSARFSKTIDLRGHMPRFYSKNEHFPIYLIGNTINVCWNPQNSAHVFPRQSMWGVTCLGLVEKWTFSLLHPRKHHKCVLKPSEQCSFFWDDRFEGSHA